MVIRVHGRLYLLTIPIFTVYAIRLTNFLIDFLTLEI